MGSRKVVGLIPVGLVTPGSRASGRAPVDLVSLWKWSSEYRPLLRGLPLQGWLGMIMGLREGCLGMK